VSGKTAFFVPINITHYTKAANPEVIPTALLTRARDIAIEHKQLTEKLANGFDTRAAKKLGEYSPIVNALGEWDKANEVSGNLERAMSAFTDGD
jgi:peptide chain release factor 1